MSTTTATMVAENYIQNSGWTPDGRAAFASALVISRGAMPDERALQAQLVAENNRVASRNVWDGTLTGSGQPVDFTTLDFFRIQDGLIAEHWKSVDWVRAYQPFGLLSEEVNDAESATGNGTGPIPGQRINARRCRFHDRCPPGACTEIPGRYP